MAVTYLCSENDRQVFGEKIVNLEKIQSKILEFRKLRNVALSCKSRWENTIEELRSLNRTISCGEMRCMTCGSSKISFMIGNMNHASYSFDVSTVEMRAEIIKSIQQKISGYQEEITKLTEKIEFEQKHLISLMEDEKISLESIVMYKKEIFSATDAVKKIQRIESDLTALRDQLKNCENSLQQNKTQRLKLMNEIVQKMNEFYHRIDPDGNIKFSDIFTQKNEVYSGSEATVFHVVKLFALQQTLHHNFPIVIDSFRAEDLSTMKEKTVLEISESIKNQVIFTTTLKSEELGKYDRFETINHIDYQLHKPSKILDISYVSEFSKLLSQLKIQLN